jgi:hypothetical protein
MKYLAILLVLVSCGNRNVPTISLSNNGVVTASIPEEVLTASMKENIDLALDEQIDYINDGYELDTITIGFSIDGSLGGSVLEVNGSSSVDFHYRFQ